MEKGAWSKEMEQGAREIIREQDKKLKRSREQRAVEIGKKERALKNGGEHGEQGKMRKRAGSMDLR